MTRRIRSVAPPRPGDKRSFFDKVPPARNLTSEVVDRITAEVESGRLMPGARLPTEQAMMAAFGVSRTVVREAIAALRADGLVTSRQGAGVFVARDSNLRPFRIGSEGLSSIADVLNVMELRMAIEIEAAALAAERAPPARLGAIEKALAEIDRAIGRKEGAVAEDFAFHRAIAAATGNPQFVRFLEFLGRVVIPRQSIRLEISTPEEKTAYLTRVQREHRRIFAAISNRDPADARRAVRDHLSRSLARYRAIAEANAPAVARRDTAAMAK
jgi:GntR family transcriptional regulator, transcriptional repressor for pyruvate dehydrogenase complex